MIEFITSIEDKTKKGLYEYSEFGESRRTMGLFGTGFMTFKDSKPDDVRKLVELLINVNKDDDQDRILKYVEAVFQQPMHGIKTGVASVLLHCLKPHIFPVFNRNMGIGQSVFSELGIGLSDPLDLETYIENVKLVIDFRDEHFSFKNFRVLDFASRLLFKNVLKSR